MGFSKSVALLLSVVLLGAVVATVTPISQLLPIALANHPFHSTEDNPDFASTNKDTKNKDKWTSVGSARIPDGSCASTTQKQAVLTAWGFSFGIPAGAKIEGIMLQLKSDQSNSGSGWNVSVGQGPNFVPNAANSATITPTVATSCGATTVNRGTVGSNTTLWGSSWNSSNIDSLAVKINSGDTTNSKRIDGIIATAYWTLDTQPTRTTNATVSPDPTNGRAAPTIVTATVTDYPNPGGSGVAAAEFYINSSPGPFGSGTQMSIVQGSVGDLTVGVSGEIAIFNGDIRLLPEGLNTVNVRARDVAGNVEETASYTFLVDYTPPILSLPGIGDIQVTPGAGSTSNVLYTVGATDPFPDGSSVAIDCEPGEPTGPSMGEGTFFATFSADLQFGTHQISCNATDLANNNDTATFTFELQTSGSTDTQTIGYTGDGQPIQQTTGGAQGAGRVECQTENGTELTFVCIVSEVGSTKISVTTALTGVRFDDSQPPESQVCLLDPILMLNDTNPRCEQWIVEMETSPGSGSFAQLNSTLVSIVGGCDETAVVVPSSRTCFNGVVNVTYSVAVPSSPNGTLTVSYVFLGGEILEHVVSFDTTSTDIFRVRQQVTFEADEAAVTGSPLDPSQAPPNNKATLIGSETPKGLGWKNDQRLASLIAQGVRLGNYDVPTAQDAINIFENGAANSNNAYDALAAHLLAAKLNVLIDVRFGCAMVDMNNADSILANAGYAGALSLPPPDPNSLLVKNIIAPLQQSIASKNTNSCNGSFTLTKAELSLPSLGDNDTDNDVFPVLTFTLSGDHVISEDLASAFAVFSHTTVQTPISGQVTASYFYGPFAGSFQFDPGSYTFAPTTESTSLMYDAYIQTSSNTASTSVISGTTFSKLATGTTVDTRLGKVGVTDNSKCLFFQWTLSNTSVPDTATITGLQVKLNVKSFSSSTTPKQWKIMPITERTDWSTTNSPRTTTSYANVWNECHDGTAFLTTTVGGAGDKVIDLTSTQGAQNLKNNLPKDWWGFAILLETDVKDSTTAHDLKIRSVENTDTGCVVGGPITNCLSGGKFQKPTIIITWI